MITLGQLKTFSTVLSGLPFAQLDTVIAEKGENLSDDAVLAADVLGDIGVLLPPPFSVYAEVASVLLTLAASGAMSPGSGANDDALGRGGRRG